MSQVINIGAIDNSRAGSNYNPGVYFNNLSFPAINVSQDVGDSVQNYFEGITKNKLSAEILASAVIFTSMSQQISPMETIAEFRKVPPGELNQYLAVFLNLNRVGTSVLGINNSPTSNEFVKRSVIL